MASSQIKSENPPGIGPHGVGPHGGFPFPWSSPVIPGTDTVITSLRSDPLSAVVESADKDQTPELMRRLFPTTAEADDVQGICVGHFTVQRRIGVGGMGSVFLATDEQLRRNVALKILSPALTSDPAAVLRFQNEARAAARLDHDNIARIFFYGEDSGMHYIAYEYIPGSNLRDVIRSRDRLPPAEAVNYAMQLTAALSHTAAAGVIHRDIKPSNVLITPQGRAKLVDLGLARKESADSSLELTVAGTTLGTFDYISPEQAKDPRSVDVRSDIYSLGCTLYHMLTGEPPYPEGTVLQKLLDHQGKDPPDPAKKNRRVPPALSAIVRKMMASDPKRRYSNPAKLLGDLLKVARLLGTGAVPIDGQVWLTATRNDQPFWQGNIGWIATAASLLIVVLAMERFPQLTQQLNPRVTTTAFNPPQTPKQPDQATASPSFSGSTAAPIEGMKPKPGGANISVTGPAQPVNTLPAASIPRSDASPVQKVFDNLPLLSSQGDGDIIKTALPDKSKFPESKMGIPMIEPVTPRSPGPSAAGITTPPADPRPAITIVGGKSYESLEAACSEAKDGTIIELRYNGRRGRAETPIRLTNKENVTIRSGVGFRPIIEFSPTEPPTEAESRMMTVTGGSLQLVKVDVVLTVPERITAERWAVFSLERPRELQLHDVTVTVANPSNQPACVIEQKAAPGQGVGNMGIMKNGTPVEPPRITVFDTLIRGHCDLIVLRDAVTARFQLKDTVVALQGALLHACCQTEMNNSDNDRIWLELDFVTCLTSGGLVLTEGVNQLNDHTPPVSVTARDNIFWCESSHPLVAMMDAGELMEMQRRFVWSGDRNQYDGVGVFWQLGGRQGAAPARQLDYEAWRSYWGSNEGTGSVNLPVKWRKKSADRIWVEIDPTSVELDSTPQSGRVPGATLSKVPSPPGDKPALIPEDDESFTEK